MIIFLSRMLPKICFKLHRYNQDCRVSLHRLRDFRMFRIEYIRKRSLAEFEYPSAVSFLEASDIKRRIVCSTKWNVNAYLKKSKYLTSSLLTSDILRFRSSLSFLCSFLCDVTTFLWSFLRIVWIVRIAWTSWVIGVTNFSLVLSEKCDCH